MGLPMRAWTPHRLSAATASMRRDQPSEAASPVEPSITVASEASTLPSVAVTPLSIAAEPMEVFDIARV
jgi:hypothetical protein